MSASPSQHVASSGSPQTGDPVPAVGPADSRPAFLRRPALVAAMILVLAFAAYAFVDRQPELSAVQNGRRFSPAERRQAEKVLQGAGIDGVQSRGAQLLVPPSSLQASDAALAHSENTAESDAKQATTTASLFDQFATGRRQERVDAAARAAKLERLLAQLPGIESAEIVWDEEPAVGRRRAPRVMATVFLKPANNGTIGRDTVQAVRAAVAGSRAHLAASDIAVMDLQQKVTWRGELDAAHSEQPPPNDLANSYQNRISEALSEIAGLQITVALKPVVRDGQTTVRKQPFAGLSGPNLRLEVASQPTPVQTSYGTASPHTSIGAQQLEVSVDVPGEHVIKAAVAIAGSRTGGMSSREVVAFREYVRRSVESHIRNRIETVLADAPTELAPARVTVRLASVAESDWPVPAGSAGGEAFQWNWSGAQSLVALLQRRPDVTGLGLVALILTVATLTARARRRSAAVRPRKPPVSQRPPAAFLPGIHVKAWAPLMMREPVDIVAGLLTILPPEEVSQVLAQFEPAQQRELLELTATATLDERRLSLLRRQIRAELKARPLSTKPVTVPSVSIPGARPPEVDESQASRPFGFDDLARLDENSLQQLAARVNPEAWSAALVGASPKLHRRLSSINRISSAIAAPQDRRPLRLREIEAAQRMIVDEWRALTPQS